MAADEPFIVGWKELVDLPQWGVAGVRAKVDTGARTSAIHVGRIEHHPGEPRVRFEVIHGDAPGHAASWVEADVVRQSVVRPSTGAAQERLVVRTRLRIGPLETEADVSLVCRRGMRCRMLVGRTAIAGLAVVDPGRIHVLAPTAAVPTRGTAVSLRARRRRGRDPSTPSHEGKA